MSQELLARRCGYNRATVANVEAGNQRPTIHTLLSLAKPLAIDYRRLLPSPEELGVQAIAEEKAQLSKELQKAVDAVSPGDAGKVETFIRAAVDGAP